jgi:hypothetical protein
VITLLVVCIFAIPLVVFFRAELRRHNARKKQLEDVQRRLAEIEAEKGGGQSNKRP